MLWEKPFLTGEENMCHSLDNLEYHHFKYAAHRVPGDVHLHFFGTATLSFADGIRVRSRATNSRSSCRRWVWRCQSACRRAGWLRARRGHRALDSGREFLGREFFGDERMKISTTPLSALALVAGVGLELAGWWPRKREGRSASCSASARSAQRANGVPRTRADQRSEG